MSSDTSAKPVDPFAVPPANKRSDTTSASANAAKPFGQTGAAGLVEEVASAPKTYGRGPIGPDPRKFRYDRLRGEENALPFTTEKEDRMSVAQGNQMLHAIHEMFGIASAPHEVICAFDKALFFQHTINGGSTLQPGRATIGVGGEQFDMSEVVKKLGNDARRFYRCFADEITQVNREVYDGYNGWDFQAVDHHAFLLQVAAERQLTKYPWLAHDSADACKHINGYEREAIMRSKRNVLEQTANAVDALRVVPRVPSAVTDANTARPIEMKS